MVVDRNVKIVSLYDATTRDSELKDVRPARKLMARSISRKVSLIAINNLEDNLSIH